MKPYRLPIIFTWLALLISLEYVTSLGWRDTSRERDGWDWYLGYAENLATQGRYQDCVPESDTYHCATQLNIRAYRLPGYPAFLAMLIYLDAERVVILVKISQAVLYSMTTFLTVSLALRITCHEWAGVLVGVLMLSCRLTYWIPVLYTETLYTFVLMAFVYTLLSGRVSLAGILWGASLLIRSSFVLATPLFLLLMSRRDGMRFVVLGSLILAPYALRNYVLLGTFAPLGTNGGNNLRVGHNQQMYQTGGYLDLATLPDWDHYRALNEIEQDKALRQAGMEHIRDHWRELPRATWLKWRIVLGAEGWFMLAAFIWRRSPPRLVAIAGVLWVGMMANAALFFGVSRFREPLDPLLYVVLVVGLVRVVQMVQNRQTSRHRDTLFI